MARRPEARSECRELAKNAGGLRSLAGDAAASSKGRQGADGRALTKYVGLTYQVSSELEGKSAGETIEVPLDCNKIFGPWDESLVITESIRNVPEEYREVGTAILMENDRGETKTFLVTRKDRKTITIDGNNPLCGREVIFKLEILLVRDASEEEIAAGGKVEKGPDIETGPSIHEVLN